MTAGVHNVTVTFGGDASYYAATRTTAALTVTRPKSNIAFSLYAASGVPGASATLKTLVVSGGSAVIGKAIAFAVDGTPVRSSVSDASGSTSPSRGSESVGFQRFSCRSAFSIRRRRQI